MFLQGDNVVLMTTKSLSVPAHPLSHRLLRRIFPHQRSACYYVGQCGSLVVRCLLVLAASWITAYPGLKLGAAVFMVVMAMGFIPRLALGQLSLVSHLWHSKGALVGLPGALTAIVAVDATASLDNVLAAVSITTNTAQIILAVILAGLPGILLGHHIVRAITRLPSLVVHWSGKLLMLSIGCQIILSSVFGITLDYMTQMMIFGLAIVTPFVVHGHLNQTIQHIVSQLAEESEYAPAVKRDHVQG